MAPELTKFGPWESSVSKMIDSTGLKHEFTVYLLQADHGLFDRGQRVGGVAHVEPQITPQRGANGLPDYSKPYVDTGRWVLRLYALRNGMKYGAIPRPTIYDTLSAAQAAAVKGLELQRKRYQKKFGPGRAL